MPGSHATRIGAPVLNGSLDQPWQRLDPRLEVHRTLAHPPVFELGEALHSVHVEGMHGRRGAVTKRRVHSDHRLDGLDELVLQLRR